MTKYRIIKSTEYKKNVEILKKRGYDIDLLNEVVTILKNGESLPQKNKDHALKGNLKGYRECHIQPDWLLVYKIHKKELILLLSRTGTHSDLF